MKKEIFKPIILGTDKNAYSVAKSFHKEYGIKSLAFGKRHLHPTRYSRIIAVSTFDKFNEPEFFLQKMIEIGKEYSDKYEKLLLISCSDGYTQLISNHKKELEKFFVVPYVGADLQRKLENKDNFYKICEKHKISYPKTYIHSYKEKKNFSFSFSFPVIVKPADSIKYAEVDFSGKKKAFYVESRRDLLKIIDKIYSSNYRDNIIIQEYIPGDDSSGWVLSTYSNSLGKVKMMCLGDVVLEHCAPKEIGNYAAIISSQNEKLYKKFKDFLEDINYIGLAHFDLKYDFRDKTYKTLEMNLRQGRSYYTTLSGNNIAKLLVDEYVFKKKQDIIYNRDISLWLDIPKKTLLKYANPKYIPVIKKLLREKKYGYTLFYKKDIWPWRLIYVLKLHNINKKLFRLYFNKK